MDATRSDDQTNKNGPSNAAQSLFDPTGLLGYSQYAAALSAASGSYPHMAGGFSLFPPPSAMFPGAAAAAAASLPFGGLGSFGDSLLGSTALSDASSGSTEWWRLATERANQLAESSSGFYGNLAGSLQGTSSLCPSSVASPLPSANKTSSSSARASHDRSPSDAGGGHRRSTASPSSSSSSRRGDAASTSHRGKHETKRERMSATADIRLTSSSSPSKSGVSNSGASTNHLHEKFELTPGGPEAAKCAPTAAAAAASSLESSLLSAEAALLHAASPLFFPFPLPPLFGGSNPLLPFSSAAGLLSEMQPSTTSAGSLYSPVPSVLPPLSSHSSEGRARSACSTSSKGSSSTAATVVRSPMRGMRDGDAADGGRTASAGSSHEAERNRAGSRSGKSVIVSPALSSLSEPSAPSPQPHVKQRCREKRSWQPAAHDGGGYGVDLTERHAGRDLSQPKVAHEASNRLSNSASHDRSEPSRHTSSYDAMTFSDVGAIDLSVKRPCRSSPAPLPPKAASPKTAPSKSVSMPSSLEPAQSVVDALSTLFSQQPGLSDPSALMQFLAGQQIAAANAGNIPDLSLSLATAASLFPPMFDGVSGLFYPPAVLAAMAAPSQGSDTQTSANNQAEKSKGRGRGRRRGGGRGARSSSMFISNLFTQQAPGSSHGNEVKVGRGRGSRGRQPKGRGRQQVEPLPGSLLDLERQRYFEQMLRDQSAAPSMAHGASSGKESRASSRLSKSATGLTSHESLTNKMLHQQSKLAQALTSDVCHTVASSEPVLNMSSTRTASDHQDGNSRDHRTGLMHTDSEFGNEDTSSACSTDSEADGHSVLGGEADHAATGAREKRKQESTSDGDGLPVKKRRRTILDETILRLPLDHGWQRETRVRSFTPRKIIGEVLYVTPCDRKLRNYNEVDKFLEKNRDGTLTRENFSFSTKVNVGRFYEQCVSSEGTKWVQMSDDGVAEKYVVIEERKKRIIENKMRAQLREEKRQKSEEMLSKLAEQRLQRRLEQQELARKVAEMKMRKKAEKEHQREMLHRARQLRVMEVRRMKERQKMARQQERYHRQMQLRMERELRSRQMIEEKEVRRQQDVALKEQERERRRLDLLMAKALEAQKKEQEKERLKNEKKNAKKLDREKKLAQKRLEIFLAREQRRPIEDMSIQDAKPLPEFDRIPGLRLPGKAFADCLMVLEFVHNFSSILGFDADSIPTLNILQGGLFNVEGCVKEFFAFTKRLLKCALDDPGFPNAKEGVLISGQKLTDLEIPDDAISEPLRIFIKARVGHEDEMSSRLLTTPFASLNPTHKAAILAFICNELLCNKEINAEIEKNVDHVTNLRRDKWITEGKLRKLRVIQAQRQRKLAAQKPFTATPSAPAASVPAEDSNNVLPASGMADSQLNHTLPDSDADSDNDAPPPRFSLPHDSETEEDKKASLEELEAKIEKLVKQQNQLREKIFNLSHKLSAFSFGHDRYRRQYWVLTKCGGIFVEGLESGEPDSADPNAPETDALVESLSAQAVASGMEASSVSMVTETKYDTRMDVSVMSSISLQNEVKQEVNCDGDRNYGAPRSYSSPNCRVQSNDFKVDADLSTVSKTELLDMQTKPLGFGMAPKNGFFDLKMASFDGALDLKYHGDNSDEIYKLQSRSVEVARTDIKEDGIKPSFTMPSADGTNLSSCKSELNLAASTPLRTNGMPESDVAMSESLLFGAGLVPRTPSLVALQHGYPLSSSRLMSRVDTPCSDLGGSRSQFDNSAADTPLSLTQPSRTSTPSHMSTTFADDLPLGMFSADSELQPDFLAVPKNVRPISLAKQRGWWRITNPDQIKELVGCLNQRGIRERNLQKTLERYMTFACQSCSKSKKSAVKLEVTEESKRILSSPTSAPAPDDNDAWDFQLQRQIEMRVLEEIEKLEERICKASLQTKGWTSLPAVTTDNSVALISSAQKLLLPNQQYIINTGRLRLLSLERNIERRYLKPPLGRSNQLNLANVSGGGTAKDNRSSSDDDSDADDETATKDMNLWRLAVSSATSAAQLSLYISQLSACIAWEKSIMKVLCQICCRDDNEAQLLLCDICDRGYHTYCIKPKLDSIPEGDWYCHECISKASGDICCIACGLQGSRLVTCEFCSRRVHLDCLEPPMARMPKKWTCYSCSAERGKRKRSRPSTATSTPQKEASSIANSPARIDETENEKHADVTAEAEDGMSDAEDSAKAVASEPAPQLMKERPSKSSKERSERKRDRHRKEKKGDDDGSVSAAGMSPACNGVVPMDDMNVCKAILSEMREHTDAWPFLTPVNTKQFPTYRKVIRCPIDFQTIGRKLKTNAYKSHDEFASDTRLVFSNCEMFNEDDSLVGQAGHSMKQFFEARWAELTAGSESATMPPQQSGS